MPPKTKKPDEVAALAGLLVEALEAKKQQGGPSYPPTLRQLAEAAGVDPDDDRLMKAVARPAFTKLANAKPTGTVGLDQKVYLKADVPSKVELERMAIAELADRMAIVHDSQRQLGGDAYPPTLRRLAELCELTASTRARAPKAVVHESVAKTLVAVGTGKTPKLDSPVLHKDDIKPDGLDHVPALLKYALAEAKGTGKASLAFNPKQLAGKLQKPIQPHFEKALKEKLDRKDLPEGYAWVQSGKNNHLIFRLEDLQTTGPDFSIQPAEPRANDQPAEPKPHIEPAETGDFAKEFREAFDRLDLHNGKTNFVRLLDLRRELPGFDRGRFDSGLRKLREAAEFSLGRHEGLHNPLKPEEIEAGITEVGSLFVYVYRRN